MTKSNDKITTTTVARKRLDGAKSGRGSVVFSALVLTAVLNACTGSLLEARPVCIKPHGGANYQLAPSDQCESGMGGSVWVNR